MRGDGVRGDRDLLLAVTGPAYCHVCLNHVRSRLHYELCIVNTPKETR